MGVADGQGEVGGDGVMQSVGGWGMWRAGRRQWWKADMWEVGCGMWDVGCGMWEVGCDG
jgi:hypothetical protein